MSLLKENSMDLPPTTFNRSSKLRKSFRIRHRYNSKIPPAAVIFMKSLETNKANKFDSIRNKSTFYVTRVENSEVEPCTEQSYDPMVDDEEPLIKKSPVLRKRSSFKNLTTKKKLKTNFIQFFRQ